MGSDNLADFHPLEGWRDIFGRVAVGVSCKETGALRRIEFSRSPHLCPTPYHGSFDAFRWPLGSAGLGHVSNALDDSSSTELRATVSEATVPTGTAGGPNCVGNFAPVDPTLRNRGCPLPCTMPNGETYEIQSIVPRVGIWGRDGRGLRFSAVLAPPALLDCRGEKAIDVNSWRLPKERSSICNSRRLRQRHRSQRYAVSAIVTGRTGPECPRQREDHPLAEEPHPYWETILMRLSRSRQNTGRWLIMPLMADKSTSRRTRLRSEVATIRPPAPSCVERAFRGFAFWACRFRSAIVSGVFIDGQFGWQ